ncbi:hypothetical protein GCM10010399_74450 [Dactylosporangium fulvum]|uniref:CBS domain-containing protein n=1 Tax=Dactylosporangium fulvum TaxID=53359 RepID=A0ABY5VNS3_9ACTN|nr:CBS domain-containing protein [Dactylosporangium fulvum]UWP79135.1 CBS domain-containing protein [Dactylosporangium fulvum]
MRAKDIMSRPAHTVRADQPVADAVALLQREHIASAPVVDADGVLVGLVSELDVLRAQPGGGSRPVREVMSGHPVAAWPDADIAELARLMVDRNAHNVPVVTGEHVLGVVSHRDVLRTVVPTDETAAAEAQRRLDTYAGGRPQWTVSVTGGAAAVTGPLDDDTDRAVVVALVGTTAGVRDVRVAGPR